MSLRQDVYEPIIEALAAGDGGPKLISDLAELPAIAALPPGALIEGLAVLIGSGRAHPAQADADCGAAKPACDRLNSFLIERSRISGDVECLASPVTGGGVTVGRFEQMFLGARARQEDAERLGQGRLGSSAETEPVDHQERRGARDRRG